MPDSKQVSARESRTALMEAIPPGLESLYPLDGIFVKQEIELAELFCGCEGKNHYSIKKTNGQEIMKADETSGCCSRQCCGKARPFTFNITDFNDHNIKLERNLAWGIKWCPCSCCRNQVKVTLNGELLGKVQEQCSFCTLHMKIKDSNGDTVLKIRGPSCCGSNCCKCCCAINFKIYNMDGQKVGVISKKWGGFVKEAITDADSFGVTFPQDLDVKLKAVLLGACILIDFLYFEDNAKGKEVLQPFA